MSTTPTLLASLRHLYENMVNGGVRDTASAKRIAEGLLSPAIAELERAALTQGAVGSISSHIKQPYTLAEIRAKIDSHDYSAELLLQHAMLLLEGAGAVEPFAYAVECYPHRADIFKGETAYEFREQGDPKDAIFTAQQLQQAVAREREECAVICERAVDSIWEYHEDNHKRTGRNVCTNLAAAIRSKGTHD